MMKTASIHQAKLLFSLLLVFAFLDLAFACCSVTDKCTDELKGEEKDDADECTEGGGEAHTDELYVDRVWPLSKECVCCTTVACTAVSPGCDTEFGDRVINTEDGEICADDEHFENGDTYAVKDGDPEPCGCCKICKVTDMCTDDGGERVTGDDCKEEKDSYRETDEAYTEGSSTCSCCRNCAPLTDECENLHVMDGFYKCTGKSGGSPRYATGGDRCYCCGQDIEENTEEEEG